MIQVTCTHCGLRILVPDTVEGRTGLCFGCGGPVRVPTTRNRPVFAQLTLQSGDRVNDRYLVEAQIGSGGMGVVYKAHDVLIDEPVALKVMNMEMLSTQRGQNLFIKEAQIARRLRHENIVAVHDAGTTTDGILYLTMELLSGQRLRDRLREHRKEPRICSVHFTIGITLQILSALAYAHRYVVHRDLKPENVMLEPGDKVKVLDFGLALAVQAGSEASAASGGAKPATVVGTEAYAAPEQKLGQSVDLRADIYTVGLLLHELLTLRTPIDEPVTVEQVRQDVPPSILRIREKALSEDREDRWQSAQEFHDALAQAYHSAFESVEVAAPQSDQTASTENMVLLRGGRFLMGNNDISTERPEFEAEVAPFYMDLHPVTNDEYGAYLEAAGAREPKFWDDPDFNGPDQPVVGVSYNEAAAYAAWAGKQLPTEKQWEFAARGRDNRPYPWGAIEPEKVRANFHDYLGMTSVVSMHEDGASPDGVVDLGGNVYEWTRDAFAPYTAGNRGDNTRIDAPRRSIRGGCWKSPAEQLRSSHRSGAFPEARESWIGFRCVVPVENP